MYHALYRKYRPKDFDSVVGQDSIIKTLKNSIIHKNFSHAYMFFGPRGTGKTSVSKIFARNINCLNPKNGIACEECDACKVSFSKDCVDIIEIDAASNNGVDEIRDLKNKISLVPSELRYKVYIIDEVHMLSIGAFNALLKTLEEPPEHAIFILATTDPQKVPETIVSRCQCFSFKRISDNAIVDRLRYVCNCENIEIDDNVLEKISILSDGGLRDSLGMLDKLVSYSDHKITIEDFNDVNGVVSDEDISKFLDYILTGNIVEILNFIKYVNDSGKNLIQVITQLIVFSRNMVVDYYISKKDIKYSVDLLQNFLNLINEKMFDIKKSGNTKIYIEMFLLKFVDDYILNTNSTMIKVSNDVNNHINKTNNGIMKPKIKSDNNSNPIFDKTVGLNSDFNEKKIDNSNASLNDNGNNYMDDKNDDDYDNNDLVSIPKITNIDEIMKVRVNNTLAKADKNLLRLEMKNFTLLNDYTFDQEIGYLVCAILDAKLRVVRNDCLVLSYDYDSNARQNLNNLEKITDVYNKITNSNKNIAIITDEYWEKVKNEYILNIKNNVKYEVVEEPEPIFEELKNNDIITSSAVELFGDIVEVE